MNLSQRLQAIASAITSRAPQVAELANEVESIGAALAGSVASAVPGTAVGNLAQEVANVVNTIETVQTAVVAAVSQTPAVDTSATVTPTVDLGAVAAANVSQEHGADSQPARLSARLALLEANHADVQTLLMAQNEALVVLLNKFGL